jgi:protein SCO1/2
MLTFFIPDKSVATLSASGITEKLEWDRSQQHRTMQALSLSLVFLLGYLQPVHATEKDFVKVTSAKEALVEINLVDSILIDQDGRRVKFASQAIGDRIVVINFIYTTCGTVCPLISATFKQLQDKLGQRLGKDVWLVSISLDPVTDTPARLKEYAARYHAKPGWLWFTGNATNVERVLNGLGTTLANFREHAPLTLVGDGKRGLWVQLNSLMGPQQIRAELDDLWAARKRGSGSQ